MSDPKVIYLGPACQKEGDGREWCEDDVWPECECGCPSVKYMLESDAQSQLAALREELATAKRNEHNSEVAYKAAIEKQEELRVEAHEQGLATRDLRIYYADLQQRLADAERRNAEMVGKIGEAYEWGYSDGQNNPNGYSDKADRDACVAALQPTESGASE